MLGRVDSGIMLDRLSHFRFTNLKDPDVYYNDQNRSLAGTAYRTSFMLTAAQLAEEGRPDEAVQVLDRVMDEVPPDTIPLLPFNGISLAETYREVGQASRSVEILDFVAPRVIQAVRTARDSPRLNAAVQQVQQVQGSYIRAGAFEAASSLGGQLADLLGDDSFRITPEAFRRLYEESL
jgi:hypothetical protein